MNEGYITLHRKMMKWEWYDDSIMFRLFVHCLFKANWIDKKWHGVNIKGGSFITSYSSLAKELKLSIMQIRNSLTKLKVTGEITVKTTNKYSVITVNNYNQYQKVTGKVTVKQQANEQSSNNQVTTTNKDNKDNNIIKRESFPNLSDLKESDFEEIAHQYGDLPLPFVRSVFDDIINWHEENPKRNNKKNWKATLRNWVKRDALKIRKEAKYGKQIIGKA